MGAFGWFKRVLFGAESLAKSGVEKGKEASEQAYDVGRDKLSDIKDELSESVDAAKDKFDDLFDKASDKAGEGVSKAKEALTDASDNIGIDKLKDSGKKLMEDGSQMANKAGESIEQATEKIVDASDQAWEKIADTSSNLYEKAKNKAEEIGDKIGDKMDDMLDKAEKMKAEEALEDAQNPTGIYEGSSHNEKLEGSLLDGTDDFFSKAEAFADGDYDKAAEGKMTIERVDLPTEEVEVDDRKVAGFEDRDGDGDEIIDDAIVLVEGAAATVVGDVTELKADLDEEAQKLLGNDSDEEE